jgi:sugar lactone lactonase YvrE
VSNPQLQTLVKDLSFGEAPRWRPEGLYFVDIYAHKIVLLRSDGSCAEIAALDGPISGLGWLPDGRLLVVSMYDRRVLRRELNGAFVTHADLSTIATGHANDMIVTNDGTAFVGNFGFSLHPPSDFRAAALAKVTPQGQVSSAATGLAFPNGMVITPDASTIVVAESRARCLTAFDLSPRLELSNRRTWAGLPDGAFPDGICLDEEGAIWVASPSTCEVLRVHEGGRVDDRIATGQQAIACMLGGATRNTLFILTAESRDPDVCRLTHRAQLKAVQVAVAGCGLP